MQYQGDGQVFSHTDFNGHTTTYQYETTPGHNSGRLPLRVPDPVHTGEPSAKFVYNADGTRNQAGWWDPNQNAWTDTPLSYAYDAQGRVKQIAGPVGTLQYEYDAGGNRTKLTTLHNGVQSGTTTYQYDGDNRLWNILPSNDAAQKMTLLYDPAGNRSSLARPNGILTTYQYDSLNRLTDVLHTTPATAASYHYTLRADGKRTAVTAVSVAGTEVSNYQYDDCGRLTSETDTGTPYSYAAQYAYDAVGNRIQVTQNGVTTTSGFDLDDHLYGEVYDANGNVLVSGGAGFSYDSNNRLTSVTRNQVTTSYQYDVDGNRIRVVVGGLTQRTYLVDPEAAYAQVVEERDGTGALLARYEAPDDVLRMDRFDTPATYYYLADGLNSTRFLIRPNTDGTSTITDWYNYDAWGNLLNPGQTGQGTPNPFGFNGQQWDSAANAYYLRARYYNPGTARFLSQDPYEGAEEDPVTLHRYLYACADPIDNCDPRGLYTSGFGYAVQKVIQDTYAAEFAMEIDGILFGEKVPGASEDVRPDICNMHQSTWMEIKRLTPSGYDEAMSQRRKYIRVLGPEGYEPDVEWVPSVFVGTGAGQGRWLKGFRTAVIVVDNTPVLVFNALGVLFWTTATDIEADAETAAQLAADTGRMTPILDLLAKKSVLRVNNDEPANWSVTAARWSMATFVAVGIPLVRQMITNAQTAERGAEEGEDAAITLEAA